MFLIFLGVLGQRCPSADMMDGLLVKFRDMKPLIHELQVKSENFCKLSAQNEYLEIAFEIEEKFQTLWDKRKECMETELSRLRELVSVSVITREFELV